MMIDLESIKAECDKRQQEINEIKECSIERQKDFISFITESKNSLNSHLEYSENLLVRLQNISELLKKC